MRTTLLRLVALGAFTACGSSGSTSEPPSPPVRPTEEAAPTPPPTPEVTAPPPATEVQAALFARSVNAFGLDLWKRVGEGNQTISPASVAIALDMTFAGARGETADEMARVLHVEGDRDAFHAALGFAQVGSATLENGKTVRYLEKRLLPGTITPR